MTDALNSLEDINGKEFEVSKEIIVQLKDNLNLWADEEEKKDENQKKLDAKTKRKEEVDSNCDDCADSSDRNCSVYDECDNEK